MHTSEFFEQTTIQDPWSEVLPKIGIIGNGSLKTESPLWSN